MSGRIKLLANHPTTIGETGRGTSSQEQVPETSNLSKVLRNVLTPVVHCGVEQQLIAKSEGEPASSTIDGTPAVGFPKSKSVNEFFISPR